MNEIEKQRFFDLNREVRSRWNAYFEINQQYMCPESSQAVVVELKNAWDAFAYSSSNLHSFMQHITE